MEKNVLITGASGGIGSACALLLSSDGASVALNYNKNSEKAERLADALRLDCRGAIAVRADVSNTQEVDEMLRTVVEQFGSIDVLVNNAGVSLQKLFTDVTQEESEHLFGVNLFGTINCCRAAIPYMVRQHKGSIINISSIWGVSGASCEVHYSASKAAVIGLTKALAKELGPSGIRVNCIAPGVIGTDMNSRLDEDTMAQLADAASLCRIGTPEDVARVVRFFAGDDSEFVTGQVICCDGGLIG